MHNENLNKTVTAFKLIYVDESADNEENAVDERSIEWEEERGSNKVWNCLC